MDPNTINNTLQTTIENSTLNLTTKTTEKETNTPKTLQNSKMTNSETITKSENNYKSYEKPPKYRDGDNLQIFFKLYEKAATLNGWESDLSKLEHIHTSFKGKLQEWVVTQTWDNWNDFKNALLEREEVVVKDDMHYLSKLLRTKRKNFSSLNKFIIKFDNTMQERKNTQSSSQNNVDPDSFYMKLFIKNSSPAEMRRFLKEKPSDKLTDVYKWARSYEDEDSSDDSDSDSSSTNSEIRDSSDSDSDNIHSKSRKTKTKHSMVKSAAPKIKDKKDSFRSALLAVLDNQQKQLLLLQQQPQQQQPQLVQQPQPIMPQSQIQYSRKLCYNCKEPGHYDDQCPKPCKHCGSYDHKRYSCPYKPSHMGNNNTNNRGIRRVDAPNQDNSNNNNTNTNTNTSNPSLFMSVSDDIIDQQALATFGDTDVLAIKRLRSEEQQSKENKTLKRAKKKMDEQDARAERIKEIYSTLSANNPIDSGSSSTDPGPSSNVVNPSSSTVNNSPSAVAPTTEPCEVEETETPPVEDTTIAEANQQLEANQLRATVSRSKDPVIHQVQKDPLKVKPPVFESKTATVVSELRNQKVFQLSYNEIIALSSKAHTEFRRALVSKSKLENDQVKDISDLLLNQECELPEGNHAPRTIGHINGIQVNVILDTGCTPCVISYQLVQKLGLADKLISLPKSSDGGILVGDGRRVQIKGIVKDLKLQLLPGHTRTIDAVCLDVPESAYEFLCGRIVMAQFGVCVDLGTSSWFVRNGKELDEMEVFHTAPDVDQGTDTFYLVNVQPVQPVQSEQSVQSVQHMQSETAFIQERAKPS